MNEIVYHSNYQLEDTYWWFIGRNNIIIELINKIISIKPGTEILDVGCGTCGFAKLLSQNYDVIGLDTSNLALEYCKKRGIKTLYNDFLENFPKNNHNIEVITMLDVIEHIQDDLKVVKDAYQILPVGGWFVASVPAYSFLWSVHDEIHQHFRRYNKKKIVSLIEDAGFQVVYKSYFNTILFIPGLIKRFLDKIIHSNKGEAEVAVETFPGLINNIMTKLFLLEGKILPSIRFPFGMSILIIAKK